LLDSPEPLKLWRVDKSDHQPALIAVGFQADNIVNRISVDSF
jgi:hypothetical protein